MTRVLLAALIVARLPWPAPGQALYVAPDGDDTAPGTREEPLASLAGARNAVRKRKETGGGEKDLTVYIAGGVYRLAETVVFGLQDAAPEGGTITYAAVPGQTPLFSGGVPVTGWRKLDDPPEGLPAKARDKVYVADLPDGVTTCHTLFDGLERLPRARLDGIRPARELPKGRARPSDYTSIPFPPGILRPWSNPTDVEIVARCVFAWTMNVLPVKAIDIGRKCSIHLAFPSTYPLAYNPVYVENVPEGINGPGRWAVNSGTRTLYLWPRKERPGDAIVVPRLTEMIRVEGTIDYDGPKDKPVRGIRFRGLTFAHGERYTWDVDHRGRGLQHDWEMFDAPSATVRFRGAEDCAVEYGRFVATGSTAVRLDLHGRKNRVAHCLMEHIGGVGVLLAGYGPGTKDANRDNEVVNNHFHHLGETYWHSQAIHAWQSGHNRIAHNRIHDMPYTGISIGGRIYLGKVDPGKLDPVARGECSLLIRWKEVEAALGKAKAAHAGVLPWAEREPLLHARKNVVEYNDIHQVMQVLGDGNGIYVSGCGGDNIVRWNRVYDGEGTHVVASIRCDDDQHRTRIEGNILEDVVVGIGSKGVNTIVNNIIVSSARPSRGMVYFGRAGEDLAASVFQRNILYGRHRDDRLLLEKPRAWRGRLMVSFKADRNVYFNKEDPGWGKRHIAGMQRHGVEQNSLAVDPGFGDPAKGDFDLRPDAPALALGFEPIDTRKIGLAGPVGPKALQ